MRTLEAHHEGMLDQLALGDSLSNEEISSFVEQVSLSMDDKTFQKRRSIRNIVQFWLNYYRAKNGKDYPGSSDVYKRIFRAYDPPERTEEPLAWSLTGQTPLSPARLQRLERLTYRLKGMRVSRTNAKSAAKMAGAIVDADARSGIVTVEFESDDVAFSVPASLALIAKSNPMTGRINFERVLSRKGRLVGKNLTVTRRKGE